MGSCFSKNKTHTDEINESVVNSATIMSGNPLTVQVEFSG